MTRDIRHLGSVLGKASNYTWVRAAAHGAIDLIDVWDAASSFMRQRLAMIGTSGLIPVVLVYSVFCLLDLLGKAAENGWEA